MRVRRVLDCILCQLQEGVFEGAVVGEEFVEHRRGGCSQLADALDGDAGESQGPIIIRGDFSAFSPDSSDERFRLGSAHDYGRASEPVDDLLDRSVGDESAAPAGSQYDPITSLSVE